MSRWRWLAAALLLSACASARPAPRSADPLAAAQAMLDIRSSAVEHRDAAMFVSTVSAQASVAERASQLSGFSWAGALSFRSWQLQIAGNAAPPPASGRWVVLATLRYALAGYDNSPVSLPRTLALTRDAAGWSVAADSQQDAPWDFGPLITVSDRRTLVIAHPAQAAAAHSVAALADAAIPVVTRDWGSDWSQQVVIVIPSTLAELEADLVTKSDLSRLAAVQSVELDGAHQGTGNRILLNPAAYLHTISPLGQRVILTHEITHVASQAATTPGVPLWLVEGLADTIGFGTTTLSAKQGAPELAALIAKGTVPTALPVNADFDAPSASQVTAYEQAWLACRLIMSKVGIRGLVALYRAVGAGQGVEAAMMTSLHTTLAHFTAAWQSDLRTELA